MSMLRFDASGAMQPDYGVTQEQLNLFAEPLEAARTEYQQNGLAVGTLGLPEEQLKAYAAGRAKSELGRVFQVANGLHEHLDAVIVLGAHRLTSGPLALMRACCDPYHNELSRASRGSKPRMYFAGDTFDNDVLDSLVKRIQAGGDGDTEAKDRFAIIAVSDSGDDVQTAIAFRHILSGLKSRLGSSDDSWMPRLVIPIIGKNNSLRDLVSEIDCQATFSIPDSASISDASKSRTRAACFGVLSPVGLLPAAFLGLDCMKLLEGAAAMNEHFRTASFEDNLVMQYVAVHQSLARHRGKTFQVVNAWNKALEAVTCWHDQLKTNPVHSNIKLLTSSDQGIRHCQAPFQNTVVDHLIVESCRTDVLSESPQASIGDSSSGRKTDGKTVPQMLAATIEKNNEELHRVGCPTTNIILPRIDTFVLGQLCQMWMLAAAMDPITQS